MNTQNTLTDQFGRNHDYLRISLTERCNLRCFYCMPEEGIPHRDSTNFMSTEEVLDIAGRFVQHGVKKIRLTGGEPLVRKDAEDVIRGLGKLPVELAITTNGILVDEFIDVLKESRVKKINVSLDTLQAERFNKITRRDYFTRVRNNIDLLVANDFEVKLNAVLIKGVNDDELKDFILFTENNKIEYRFIEFMPFDGNKWNFSKCLSHKEILESIHTIFPETVVRLMDNPNDTSRHYKINGFTGSFAIISSITNPFCDSCNRIRLTADGKMKNCLFSGDETDLLSIYRSGADIMPAVKESLFHKKQRRAGMESHHDLEQQQTLYPNRSMVMIGG
ncbi:GTP 3',8-cyclase MoaA [soil metagenome]